MKGKKGKAAMKCDGPAIAEALVRIVLGLVLILVGINKFIIPGGIVMFAEMMSAGFEPTWVPVILAKVIMTIVPIAEIILGLLLVIGVEKRIVALLIGIMFAGFLLGHTVLGNMDQIPLHFIYLWVAASIVRSSEDSCLLAKK